MLLYSLAPRKFCLNPAAELPRNRFPSFDQTPNDATGGIPRKQGSRIGSTQSWYVKVEFALLGSEGQEAISFLLTD